MDERLTRSLDLAIDREKGEVRISGARLAVVDINAFCTKMDALVGTKLAAVQMKSLEYRLGEEDAQAIVKEQPGATSQEVVDLLRKMDLISGVGVTKVSNMNNGSIHIETNNPIVKGTEGAAGSFISGWWSGAMSSVLKGRFDAREIKYDQERDLLKFNLERTASVGR